MKTGKELVNDLCKVFKVKSNPIMEFWFVESWLMVENKAVLPKDFDRYWLYKREIYDGVLWDCYMKQVIPGCYSTKYWSTAPRLGRKLNMKYQVTFKKEGIVTVEADSADEARMIVENMSDFELSDNFFNGVDIEGCEEIDEED